MTFPSNRPSPSTTDAEKAAPHPNTPSLDAVALHLLGAMVRAAAKGCCTHLEDLALEVGVRKGDCRSALSTLHRQGYVDVLRMRPTMSGFALGAALRDAPLRPLRRAGSGAVGTRAA